MIPRLESTMDCASSAVERDNQMTPCTWIEDADGNWRTGCKQLHIFIDGTPSENGYAYCPYCGAKIETVIYQEKP